MAITKKICGLALAFIVISAACQAAPVTDYSLGHVKLYADTGFSSFSPDYTDSRMGYDISLTAGLGFGFAGQYSYSKDNSNIALKNRQINLHDHIFGPVGVFVGASQTVTAGANAQNGLVFGVTGTMPIAPRTSAYAVLSAGPHISGREFGIGYQLDKNAELALLYRNTRYSGLRLANGANGDVTSAGFFSGISFKL